eukprot:m.11208 g.11208  ORF g.11208 m.11208 type:complete len:152 (+) comp5537_c0_seq1:30-485(+)
MAAVLRFLNRNCSWMVSSTAFAVLFYRRDWPTFIFVAGSLLNAALGKTLKYVLKHERPISTTAAAPKTHGMPSTHANSLFFFAVHLSLNTLACRDWQPASQWLIVGSLFSYASAVSLTRVYIEPVHTLAQVVAGVALGTVCAAGWYHFWRA